MPVSVIIKAWGPSQYYEAGHGWIAIGKIDEPESLDFDFLKAEAMKCIERSEHRPYMNAARLEINKDGEKMKVMLLDLW